MKSFLGIPWLAWPFVALVSVLFFTGLGEIPFHPDESTQLFMSSDFETWLTSPASLAWNPTHENELHQHYRELDAPLTRYLLGAARFLNGRLPALPNDWDWSKNWEENRQAGALPDDRLLLTGRLAITLLLPISLFLTYKIGDAIGGQAVGLIAMVLFGTNALILLHMRRAMAEGPLVLSILFAVWSYIKAAKYTWLTGFATALAFCAKQSGIALLPVGLLAAVYMPVIQGSPPALTRRVWSGALFLVAFVSTALALNPLWWSSPIQAVEASWRARQRLLSEQIATGEVYAPSQILHTPTQRVAALIAHLYLTPPVFAEVGNYRAETAAAEKVYFTQPFSRLLRSLPGGGMLFFLTLTGITLAGLRFRRTAIGPQQASLVLLAATAALVGFNLLFIPIAWQRYVIPLVPLTCIWEALSLVSIFKGFQKVTPTSHHVFK